MWVSYLGKLFAPSINYSSVKHTSQCANSFHKNLPIFLIRNILHFRNKQLFGSNTFCWMATFLIPRAKSCKSSTKIQPLSASSASLGYNWYNPWPGNLSAGIGMESKLSLRCPQRIIIRTLILSLIGCRFGIGIWIEEGIGSVFGNGYRGPLWEFQVHCLSLRGPEMKKPGMENHRESLEWMGRSPENSWDVCETSPSTLAEFLPILDEALE